MHSAQFQTESAVAMDAPSAVASDAPGFVFDSTSGLYYDASSGFYYDAQAGWYYNTHDGQYYIYENEAYVPLSATVREETVLRAVDDESNQASVQGAGRLSNPEHHLSEEAIPIQGTTSTSRNSTMSTHIAGFTADQEATIDETSSHLDKDSTMKDAAAVASDSEWQVQSFRYAQNVTEVTSDSSSGLIPGTEMSSLSMGTVPTKSLDTTEQGDAGNEPVESRPASVWIAETLNELYSQNTFETPTNGGKSGVSVDPSSQHLYYLPNSGGEDPYEYTYMSGDYNEDTWREPQHQRRQHWGYSVAGEYPATMDNELYESDDQSEELEEGEWRPEEEEKEKYVFADIDEVEEGEIRESPSEEPESLGMDGEDRGTFGGGEDPAYRGSSPIHTENYLYEDGKIAGADYTYVTHLSENLPGSDADLITTASVVTAEEQWQAQYLPAAKLKPRTYSGSMELWDWSIVEQEKKVSKKKVKKIIRLVGRLAPNATQVHPSLRGSGGLIRTTPILEADHEFVKVSSGRIYKLRRPSSKHLAVYPGCVSSNPSQDWGLPLINTNPAENYISHSSGTHDAILSTDSGLGNDQSAAPKKNSKLKFKGVDGEPQPKYRDRAAERRTLHRGFGIGPGQKLVSVHELEKEEAEAATEMPAALEKAASARRIGRDNIGKRMLEGMGWKEGQSLGSGEGGLVDPILALGNTGRTGLGWN
uniref:G-patch domain-containing protein n=1 Tax=Physcomitrium patens TaxID=3218 RepID=A0A7I4CPL2_PHYPA